MNRTVLGWVIWAVVLVLAIALLLAPRLSQAFAGEALSAPDQLPAQAPGVIGSGDQLGTAGVLKDSNPRL